MFATTNAAAIDLESGAVAQIAAARGVPMAVLRAISDPASHTLPPAALLALDPQGRINIPKIVAEIARRPSQLKSLLALAAGSARARAALRRRVETLG